MNQTQAAREGTEETVRLRWCVGKFVYMKGASHPMHFMELKRFIIDDAVDFSHLFYLRGLRSQIDEEDLDDALRKWMDGTAVKALGQACVALMDAQEASPVLREFYPGVGLIGEYVRLLLQREADGGSRDVGLRYQACGPADAANKFMVLQGEETGAAEYRADTDAGTYLDPTAGTVTLFNHNQSIRLDREPAISPETFIGRHRGAALMAIRANEGDRDADYVTVKGRSVALPCIGTILDQCRASGQNWHTRFIKGFDAAFLLPDRTPPTGLLLAACGPGADRIAGFSPIS